MLEVAFEAINTPEYKSHPPDCSLKSNGEILLRNNRHNIGRGRTVLQNKLAMSYS